MGRRKKPIEEALEMTNEMEEATEGEAAEEVAEEPTEAKAEETKEEPKAEKKPRRRRSPRKPKAPGLSIENAAEEVSEEPVEAIAKEPVAEEVAEEPVGTEVDNPPAKGRGRSRKTAGEPDFKKDLVAAASASQKSVDAMAKQWESIREMTTAITSQLEKSSQAIKGIPDSIVEAHPELVRAPAQKSQLISKFAIAASVVAVILSLLSLSLSQSARQAVLSAEVARAAQSMSVNKPVAAPAPMVQPTEKASEPIAMALPFEKTQRKQRAVRPVFGPQTPAKFRSRK